MSRITVISILIFLCWGAILKGQDSDIKFSGEFNDVPFVEFVEKVEAQTGTSFYFLEKWIKGIRVTASGADISLRQTLDKTLLPAGLLTLLLWRLRNRSGGWSAQAKRHRRNQPGYRPGVATHTRWHRTRWSALGITGITK